MCCTVAAAAWSRLRFRTPSATRKQTYGRQSSCSSARRMRPRSPSMDRGRSSRRTLARTHARTPSLAQGRLARLHPSARASVRRCVCVECSTRACVLQESCDDPRGTLALLTLLVAFASVGPNRLATCNTRSATRNTKRAATGATPCAAHTVRSQGCTGNVHRTARNVAPAKIYINACKTQRRTLHGGQRPYSVPASILYVRTRASGSPRLLWCPRALLGHQRALPYLRYPCGPIGGDPRADRQRRILCGARARQSDGELYTSLAEVGAAARLVTKQSIRERHARMSTQSTQRLPCCGYPRYPRHTL